MEEKIIGYFCPKDGFYKEEPFICFVCNKEAEPHKVADRSSEIVSRGFPHIYVNKMKEITQRNAIQMMEQGY